jgi:hypothetical protein
MLRVGDVNHKHKCNLHPATDVVSGTSPSSRKPDKSCVPPGYHRRCLITSNRRLLESRSSEVTMAEKHPDISPVRDPSIDEGHLAVEKQMRDIGADLYLEVQQYSREELEAEQKIVLRKIDWVIMPMVTSPFPSPKILLQLRQARVEQID